MQKPYEKKGESIMVPGRKNFEGYFIWMNECDRICRTRNLFWRMLKLFYSKLFIFKKVPIEVTFLNSISKSCSYVLIVS